MQTQPVKPHMRRNTQSSRAALGARLRNFIGVENVPAGFLNPLLSTLGGFIGIATVMLLSSFVLGTAAAVPIIASMGATALLLFAVPHGPLSQPWPVLGGHVVSALIGVTTARFISDPALAAAFAVAGSILFMLLGRCLHPPGAATALTAVTATGPVHALGYQFVLTPVLLNALTLLAIAVLFNLPFAWRRYPAGWRIGKPTAAEQAIPAELTGVDFLAAVRELDTFIDIRDEDLIHIYQIAMSRPQARPKGK